VRNAAPTLLALCLACAADRPPARDLPEFEARLAQLRADRGIPAYSAGIVKGGQLVWARGFGLADVAAGVSATPDTSYHLASVTKTFASTVLLQLVEEGKLDLDDPVSKYGISVQSSGVVRVRHLLTHTSSGVPGTTYLYDGDRYGLLSEVIQGASGKSFAELVSSRIITPLQLEHTAPNLLSAADFPLAGHDRAQFEQNLAKGYALDGQGRPVATPYPQYFGAAAGLISSVTDLAIYSNALDGTALLREDTRARAWTPAVSLDGSSLPYGEGWFVQTLRGVKLVWHYGYWTANSSLFIKVPERGLCFILLANSDGLSSSYPLAAGDVMVSPFAREFLAAFVLGNAPL
jgi:CubicO group peptidase (beta-lactamase class C family)